MNPEEVFLDAAAEFQDWHVIPLSALRLFPCRHKVFKAGDPLPYILQRLGHIASRVVGGTGRVRRLPAAGPRFVVFPALLAERDNSPK
ncbi:hypothetical protein [Desulfovibrio sp. 6_1_46AFAA]|uniref:hypothetical protein n=1 Tax=Desulfovibrio sp. 6_1_46AFAA TaxID=665942 RepID=UPI0018DB51D2|nr:hypothetical protein [Desulfovibrio sp. 6_1_46AFAA]